MRELPPPSWSDQALSRLEYSEFERIFVEEGLSTHGRRVQLDRLEALAPNHRPAELLLSTWRANKQKIFEDMKRVARHVREKGNWSRFYSAVPGSAKDIVREDIADGPIRFYMTMLQVAYSHMKGDTADYQLQPYFIQQLWDKDQFLAVMAWAM